MGKMRCCRTARCFLRYACRRNKLLCCLIFIGLVYLWTLLEKINHRQRNKASRAESRIYKTPLVKNQACIHPRLNPYHPLILKYFYNSPEIPCTAEPDWIEVENGTFWLTKEAIKKYGKIKCQYAPIIRPPGDDYGTKTGKAKLMTEGANISPSDFFKVLCMSSEHGNKYANVHATIAHKNAVHKRIETVAKNKDNSLGLSVLMFGFDSVSRMTWIRKLPKTREYFLNVLGGVELEGYNIVGDGTPQNLFPMLTGKMEMELPESRKGKTGAVQLDGFPWIWKDFKKAGYVTQWSEDMPIIGTFSYRMKGFKHAPVDHYMRPFYLEVHKYHGYKRPSCVGSKPRYRVLLNWLQDTFLHYRNKKKFTFAFHSEYSHENSNELQWADRNLTELLQFLDNGGFLDQTILVFMSDHGARFHNVRETVQGKLEERMPYFAFRFPTWFKRQHPDMYRKFMTNSKRLTTPFDIYETFRNIIHKTRHTKKTFGRGISLFSEIPASRTCAQAGIEPHWCACLQWNNTNVESNSIKRIVLNAVEFFNNLTENYRDVCHKLKLLKILDAHKSDVSEKVYTFSGSSDLDGRVASFNSSLTRVPNDTVGRLIQVSFMTLPGGGHFEATAKYNAKSGFFTISENEVSRTNRYGHDADCIVETAPHLRPYCFCRTNS